MRVNKSVQYSVWCDKCDNLEDYEEYINLKAAEREWRKEGWSKTKDGWLCPRCTGKEKEESE
jgi:N-acetyl-beta-hexosaminidase